MTILRKLALAIANLVQRLASSSSQEWARATQHELQFIDNDWAALFWAMGSIRILFKRKTRPLADFADIPRAARDLRRNLQRRTFAGYAITLFEAVWFTRVAFSAPDIRQKTGAALTVAGMLVLACQLFLRRPMQDENSENSYRSELERQRDFFRGGWLWLRLSSLLLGLPLFCLGGLMADPKNHPAYIRLAACFAVLFLIAIPNSLRIANRFQKQLNDLDGVLKEPHPNRTTDG